jgi:hypothetical protein
VLHIAERMKTEGKPAGTQRSESELAAVAN